MTRSLTTAIKNELATNDLRPVHLITIGFSSPVNITDCSFPLTSSVSGSSVTYTSSAFIMGLSNFSVSAISLVTYCILTPNQPLFVSPYLIN